jgi:hypothetical protein
VTNSNLLQRVHPTRPDQTMSSNSEALSTASRDPFDFTDAPPGDWLPALESEYSYHESDVYEHSDPLMEVEILDETPAALCALMATSAAEEEPTQNVEIPELNPGMSKDVFKLDKKPEIDIGVCCKQLRDMTVVSDCFTESQQPKYKPYVKQMLTFASIDAELARQDQEVQEACLKKNLKWTFLAKDVTVWAGEYPYVQAMVANANILLQPRVYRSSGQYTKVMDELAMDVLKAKRLLMEQEIDLKQDERHFTKMAGLKRAAMASNQSLIKYVDNILMGSPALISDITCEKLQLAVTREIGSTRCSGHIPVFAGMSYPLPEYLLDYNKANFISMQKKDSWAQVVSRKRTTPVVHTVYIPRYTRDRHVQEYVCKQVQGIKPDHNESVMCFAAIEEGPDDPNRPVGEPGQQPQNPQQPDPANVPEGSQADSQNQETDTEMSDAEAADNTGVPPLSGAEPEQPADIEPVPETKKAKAAKAAAAKKAKKDKADEARRAAVQKSTRQTRGSTRAAPVTTPAVVPPMPYENVLGDYGRQQFTGEMFRNLGLPTTDGPPIIGSPGASTVSYTHLTLPTKP